MNKVSRLRGVNFEWRTDEFNEMSFLEGTNNPGATNEELTAEVMTMLEAGELVTQEPKTPSKEAISLANKSSKIIASYRKGYLVTAKHADPKMVLKDQQ